jgi:predicted DNA-binding WGR domain protein
MSKGRFRVWRRSYRHQCDTKDYHIVLIENSINNRSIVLMRWGKANAIGKIKTKECYAAGVADNIYQSKICEKTSNGYNTELGSIPKLKAQIPFAAQQCDFRECLRPKVTPIEDLLTSYELEYLRNQHADFIASVIEDAPYISASIEVEKGPLVDPKLDPVWGMF